MEKHDFSGTLVTFQSDLMRLHCICRFSAWTMAATTGPYQTDSDVDGREKEPAAAAAAAAGPSHLFAALADTPKASSLPRACLRAKDIPDSIRCRPSSPLSGARSTDGINRRRGSTAATRAEKLWGSFLFRASPVRISHAHVGFDPAMRLEREFSPTRQRRRTQHVSMSVEGSRT
jgi:hypothetical protein